MDHRRIRGDRHFMRQLGVNTAPGAARSARWGHQPAGFASSCCSDSMLNRLAPAGELTGHSGFVHALAWGADGTRLFSAGDDCCVKIWHPASGHLLQSLATGHTASILDMQLLPHADDAHVITAGADSQVRHISLERHAVRPYSLHRGRVKCVAPFDRSTFLSAGDDGTVRFLDVRVRPPRPSTQEGQQQQPNQLGAGNDLNIIVDQRERGGSRVPGRCAIHSVAVHPVDGNYFATGGADVAVRLYDRRRLALNSGGHGDSCIAAYAPSHLRSLLRPTQPFSLASPRSHCHPVSGVVFSPDGRSLLASYARDDIYSFDVRRHAADVVAMRSAGVLGGRGSGGAGVLRGSSSSRRARHEEQQQRAADRGRILVELLAQRRAAGRQQREAAAEAAAAAADVAQIASASVADTSALDADSAAAAGGAGRARQAGAAAAAPRSSTRWGTQRQQGGGDGGPGEEEGSARYERRRAKRRRVSSLAEGEGASQEDDAAAAAQERRAKRRRISSGAEGEGAQAVDAAAPSAGPGSSGERIRSAAAAGMLSLPALLQPLLSPPQQQRQQQDSPQSAPATRFPGMRRGHPDPFTATAGTAAGADGVSFSATGGSIADDLRGGSEPRQQQQQRRRRRRGSPTRADAGGSGGGLQASLGAEEIAGFDWLGWGSGGGGIPDDEGDESGERSREAEEDEEEEQRQESTYAVRYMGHRNISAPKRLCLLGSRGEYVVTGSDDGNILIYHRGPDRGAATAARASTRPPSSSAASSSPGRAAAVARRQQAGSLAAMVPGRVPVRPGAGGGVAVREDGGGHIPYRTLLDEETPLCTNVVAAHPHAPMLASCGMEEVVRMWGPQGEGVADASAAAAITEDNAARVAAAAARARGVGSSAWMAPGQGFGMPVFEADLGGVPSARAGGGAALGLQCSIM